MCNFAADYHNRVSLSDDCDYNLMNMIKELSITAVSLLTAIAAMAEGYQINTLSARQIAMGHTGVSQKLGAESMFFNPAGMGFMESTVDASIGVAAIASSASAEIDGKRYETNSKVSTPMYAYAGFKIFDNLKAGVTFYTPYGSNINWGDNWPAAILNQRVTLKMYAVQPTVAWRITPKLSVGAGLVLSWGNIDLHKGLIVASSMDQMLEAMGSDMRFGDITPASANLVGSTGIRVGFNVGAMYDINEQFTVGASFRSRINMKVKAGDITVSYANEAAQKLLEQQLGLMHGTQFKAEMPQPYSLVFGVTYRPTPKWEVAADAHLSGWSTYKQLDIEMLSEQLKAFDQHIVKAYHNSWAVRLGAKYEATERLDVRAGFSVDLTPVNKNYYNPETPGQTRVSPSVGISFRPVKHLQVDVSCAYVAGCGADNVSNVYTDLIYAKMGRPAEHTIGGNYKLHAWTPAISVGYSF